MLTVYVAEVKHDARQYHDVDEMLHRFTDSQFHGGVFSYNNVANELSE